MPRSVAEVDRLLAEDMRDYATMDARALNAFHDFRRDVVYVQALGRDARLAAVALQAAVAGKEQGLAPGLRDLVAAAGVARPQDLQLR
jgi:hypothetical protein